MPSENSSAESQNRKRPREEEDSDKEDPKSIALSIHKLNLRINESERLLEAFRNEHKEDMWKKAVQMNAENLWHQWWFRRRYRNQLRGDERRAFIVAALQSDVVPVALKAPNFESSCPACYRNDAEIFRLRMQLPDFAEYYADSVCPVPRVLRKDKAVMLHICSLSPASFRLVSKALKNDTDMVLATVQAKSKVAPLQMQYASKQIKKNLTVVKAALKHPWGICCIQHIARDLQKKSALISMSIQASSNECNQCCEILLLVHRSLLDEKGVVLKAVKKRGSNLRHATKRWRRNFSICRAACEQDGQALFYVSRKGKTRAKLLQGKNFEKLMNSGGGQWFPEAADDVKNDPDRIRAAVENGYSCVTRFLPLWEQNPSFFLELLRINGKLHRDLPRKLLASNKEIAIACLESKKIHSGDAVTLLRAHPQLMTNENLMLRLAKQGFTRAIQLAPISIRNNKLVMVAACSASPVCLEVTCPALQKDTDVLSAAINSAASDICDIQRLPLACFENPNSAGMIIRAYQGNDYMDLYELFPMATLQQPNVLLAWMERGWEHSTILQESRKKFGLENEEFDLEVIRYHRGDLEVIKAYGWWISQPQEFLIKTVKADCRAFYSLFPARLQNFKLFLNAVASTPLVLQSFYGPNYREYLVDKIHEHVATIHEECTVLEGFFLHFLGGIDMATPETPPPLRSPLVKLDRSGDDVKRLIAEFAGVPLGEKVQLLRKAKANLACWGL